MGSSAGADYPSSEIVDWVLASQSNCLELSVLPGGFGVGRMRHSDEADGTRRPSLWGFLAGLLLLAIIAVVFADRARFIQDDAFISFRYAENMAHGMGLVWEPGATVQGYTNFLWTLIIALALSIGFEAISAAQTIGIFLQTGAVVLFAVLARAYLGGNILALGLGVVLATNASFSAYATGGLETALLCFLMTAALLVFHDIVGRGRQDVGRLLLLSLLLGLCGLTRLDSALFIAALILASAFSVLRAGKDRAFTGLLALAIPGAVLLFAYIAFVLGNYGDLLPNTFYVKVGQMSAEVIRRGIYYVFSFLQLFGLLMPLAIALLVVALRRRDLFTIVIVLYLIVQLGYIVSVGGDFMEYRLLVPLLPTILLCIGAGWSEIFRDVAGLVRGLVGGAAVIALVALSGFHAYTFKDGAFTRPLLSVPELQRQMTDADYDWTGIGRKLGDLFPGGYDAAPVVGVRAAGAIPFYSRLRTVDMLGLNDHWVARNGIVLGSTPGHWRLAPLGYLIDQGVNLVIGHPTTIKKGSAGTKTYCADEFYLFSDGAPTEAEDAVLAKAKVVSIPINGQSDVVLVYLIPDHAVDEQIASGAITMIQDGVPRCETTPALPS